MKIFKFGYDGYECAEYLDFTHEHNNDEQFNNDCKQVLRLLTKEAMAKQQRLAQLKKDKYDELHISNLPHTYTLSSFYDAKRIKEEMFKLGYAEPLRVAFMPFLDCVDPNSHDELDDRHISKDELIDLFGTELIDAVIEYNNNMYSLRETFHYEKYDKPYIADEVVISTKEISISTNKIIKKYKADGITLIEVFSPVFNIIGTGTTEEEANAIFIQKLESLLANDLIEHLQFLGCTVYPDEFIYNTSDNRFICADSYTWSEEFDYKNYSDYRHEDVEIKYQYDIINNKLVLNK